MEKGLKSLRELPLSGQQPDEGKLVVCKGCSTKSTRSARIWAKACLAESLPTHLAYKRSRSDPSHIRDHANNIAFGHV
jgi:hypothetical protein